MTYKQFGTEVPLFDASCLDREQWLKKRFETRTVGGSSAYNFLGMGSLRKLYNRLKDGEHKEDNPSPMMDIGSASEDGLRKRIFKELGESCEMEAGTWMVRHPTIPIISGNVDMIGMVDGLRTIGDVKWISRHGVKPWVAYRDGQSLREAGGRLTKYVAQLHHYAACYGNIEQLIICGVYGGENAALAMTGHWDKISSDDIFLFRFKVSKPLIGRIEAGAAYLAHCLESNTPPPCSTEEDAAHVEGSYPDKPELRRFTLTEDDRRDDVLDLMTDYLDTKAELSAAKSSAAIAKGRFVDRLRAESIRYALCGDYKISFNKNISVTRNVPKKSK